MPKPAKAPVVRVFAAGQRLADDAIVACNVDIRTVKIAGNKNWQRAVGYPKPGESKTVKQRIEGGVTIGDIKYDWERCRDLGVASGVIGGTAIAGGAGTIVGGLVGGIMLGVLQDGFTLQGINAFTFDIVIGAAILIAMVANIHLARLRGGGPTRTARQRRSGPRSWSRPSATSPHSPLDGSD